MGGKISCWDILLSILMLACMGMYPEMQRVFGAKNADPSQPKQLSDMMYLDRGF
jgi:hypothetical protein